MKEIVLTLPYPPSVNHYKKVGRLARTKTGKIYQPRVNTETTKRFYAEVWVMIKQWMAAEGLKEPLGEEIYMEIDLFPPDARKRDIDNPCKPLIDSIQKAGLFIDDNQISTLLIARKSIIKHGKVIVRIKPVVKNSFL